MIVPAVISIFLFGASFLVITAYYFWKIYSLTEKNQMTGRVYPATQKKGNSFLNESMQQQTQENRHQGATNIQKAPQQPQNGDEMVVLDDNHQIELEKNNNENTNPQNHENGSYKNAVDLTNNNSFVSQTSSQISNNTLKQTEDFYAKVQNAYLLISCIVFGQAIISRIFIVKLNNRIDVKDYFYLSAINTALATILYNLIYGLLIFMLKNTFVRITILRFGFIFYGLIMPFPLYNGLSDEIKSDFLIVLIAIGYSIIVQGCLQKCKNTQNIITETELMIV